MMKIQWKTCFRVGFSIFLLYLCINYLGVMQDFFLKALGAASPILIGCAIAYVVNIIMVKFEKHYFPVTKKKFLIATRRPVCLVAAFLSVVAIIVVVVSLILPEFTSCIQLLLSQIPGAYKKLIAFLDGVGIVPEKILVELSALDWQAKIGDIVEMISSYFGNVMTMLFTVITAFFSGLVVALFSIIFAIYLLLAKEKLHDRVNRIIDSYIKQSICKKTRYVCTVVNECFHNSSVGQTTEAVILGVLCTLGMLILRLPYASMIGTLIGFTALVPVVGAFIGAAVGAFMISMTSPIQALIFLVFIVVLQQLEGNIIYPKVVGESLGLPAMLILAAVTVGGGVFGVLGMLLGVPLVAAAYKILVADVNNREKNSKPVLADGGEIEHDDEQESRKE